MGDLIVAVDVSVNGAYIIVLVGAREDVLKSRRFTRTCSMLKHFRRIGSDRKKQYMRTFIKRYQNRIKSLVEVVRVFDNVDELLDYLNSLNPALIIVDDKLYDKIVHHNKIREGSGKPKYMEYLVLLADNLANYVRIIKKSNPRKLVVELEAIEKEAEKRPRHGK